MSDDLRPTDRQIQMARSFAYYDGHPRAPLKSTSRINDNLLLPLPRLVVDKGSAFLFGQDVQSKVPDDEEHPAGAPSEAQQTWLDEAWRRNKRGMFLLKISINGGIFGQAFCRLLDTKPYPRIIALDPQTVDVVTNPDDFEDVWQYTITQPEQPPVVKGDPVTRKRTLVRNTNATLDYLDDLEEEQTWSIEDQEYRGSGAAGVDAAWVTTSTQDWPYPFSPVIGCQNLPKPNDYWGESDLPEDVLTLLDGINRVASHYNKIIRLHAHPKIWTRGMGSQKLDFSTDSVIHLPAETAELKSLEMQSDLSSTKALLDELLELLSWAVRIPLVALGRPDNAGALSGVALKIRYQPLIEKTEAKRLTYGDLLIELDRRILSMAGLGDGVVTQLVWAELLPNDPLQERQTAILDDQLGIVSKHTLATQMGYEFDREQTLRADEAQTAVDAMPEPLLPGQQANDVVTQDHPGGVAQPAAPPTSGKPAL